MGPKLMPVEPNPMSGTREHPFSVPLTALVRAQRTGVPRGIVVRLADRAFAFSAKLVWTGGNPLIPGVDGETLRPQAFCNCFSALSCDCSSGIVRCNGQTDTQATGRFHNPAWLMEVSRIWELARKEVTQCFHWKAGFHTRREML
jgi:hypothetical protein